VDGKGFRPKRKKLFLSFTKLKRYFRCMATDNRAKTVVCCLQTLCVAHKEMSVCVGG
jgi:hypothetical protein